VEHPSHKGGYDVPCSHGPHLVHTEEFCLCERNIEGFDYGQEHPKMGKARIGARWLIPSDVARTALRVANELMETKE